MLKRFSVLSVSLLLLLSVFGAHSVAQDDPLMMVAQDRGLIRVIVDLETSQPLGIPDNAQELAEYRRSINLTQRMAMRTLATTPGINLQKVFPYSPAIVLEVTPEGLAALRNLPNIASIEEDIAQPPHLAQSIPMIGADQVHVDGWTGFGYAVAILDTGIDGDHTDFEFAEVPGVSRIIYEGCFTSLSVANGAYPRCAGGALVQAFGDGAAADCLPTDADGCGHGTHVAGIAAGVNGVAPDAAIIAFNVFSLFLLDSECDGNAPCVKAFRSDTRMALEHILHSPLSTTPTYPIAAINMSLGSNEIQYGAYCRFEERASVITSLLFNRGIPTVISSGNDGWPNAVGAPACILPAWTVASSDDTSTITAPVLSSFSNMGIQVDFVAPGSLITATGVGGGQADKGGTSMAAPHVAGAAAVLRQIYDTVNPGQTFYQATTDIYRLLITTGTTVTDTRSDSAGRTAPHINLRLAAAILQPTELTCGGRRATIYVENGLIIGGPDHGRPYTGTLRGTDRLDVIVGTEDADTIYGYATSDYVCGLGGDDLIFTHEGQDDIWGGDGNDTIYAGVSGDDVWGEAGDDYIHLGEGTDAAIGGDGDDTIIGDTGQDYMEGNAGNDRLEGNDGDDRIYGGSGDDLIYGHNGNDRLYGEGGDDTIYGNDGDDHIWGGNGTDDLHGQENNDWMYGEGGDGDQLLGGDGDDRLSGGDGVDDFCNGEGGPHDYGDPSCEIQNTEH